jgi:hypothetical protein
MKSSNVNNKKELFQQEKEKIYLSQQEKDNYAFSEMRHKQNENLSRLFITLVTMPWIIIKKVTFKSTREKQAQEIERLKRVIESKDRARENNTMQGLPLRWNDSYLVEDGIFSIGRYYDSNWNCYSKDIVLGNFNTYANILVGGMPGGGKTKLMQLLAYQALRHGSTVYIGDFKKLDFMKFKNKCEVITEHNHLLKVLKVLKREIEKRTKLFDNVGAENIANYNEITGQKLNRVYLIIDELGEALEVIDETLDKKQRTEIENDLAQYCKSIARLGRALGVNCIFGTQRPSVNILEGDTRDMFLKRVCFQAIGNTSRIVLDDVAAANLPDVPGRAITRENTQLKEIQVFLFDKESLANLPNKKLKIVKAEKENREIGIDIIDTGIKL